MDLLKQTIELCRMYGIKPARSKGQNFLISESAYDRIIEAAGLSSGDTVLEVGPGLGFLTAKLAARAGRVIAVELDDKLAGSLSAGLASKGVRNVEVVNEDVMKFGSREMGVGSGDCVTPLTSHSSPFSAFKVVANIPYNITSALIRKFLTAENKPSLMVLMVQEEVGERIVAKPPHMSLLAVSVLFYGEPSIVEHVPAQSFWPQPEVDSCILKIKLLDMNRGEGFLHSVPPTRGTPVGMTKENDYDKKFFQLVKFGFSSKRKMLKNNLSAGYRIPSETAESLITQAGFDPKVRAQELSVEDWKKLLELIRQNML